MEDRLKYKRKSDLFVLKGIAIHRNFELKGSYMSEPIFFHVDVNSAFLSWTACDLLWNKEIDHDLRAVPSIIGGNQATRHGIVLAKSIPSKKYGIITGEPVIDAKKKCPGLIVMPPDYSL